LNLISTVNYQNLLDAADFIQGGAVYVAAPLARAVGYIHAGRGIVLSQYPVFGRTMIRK
jgi:hypothetical protein